MSLVPIYDSEHSEFHSTTKSAFTGGSGAGKTTAAVYDALQKIHRFPNKFKWIFAFIEIYEGDPWNPINSLPIVCSKCDNQEVHEVHIVKENFAWCCGKNECKGGHKFRHHLLVKLKFFSQLKDIRDGILILDEADSYLPSEQWASLRAKEEVARQLRKAGVEVLFTFQDNSSLLKKERINIGTLVQPQIHIAKKEDESGDTDMENEFVKNDVQDATSNELVMQVWETGGRADWENMIGQTSSIGSNRQPPSAVIVADKPPSLIFKYFWTGDKVEALWEPEITEEKVLTSAKDLWKWFKDRDSYIWGIYLKNGEMPLTSELKEQIRVWNDEGRNLSPSSLNRILVAFKELAYIQKQESSARKEFVKIEQEKQRLADLKPRKLKCDKCKRIFTGSKRQVENWLIQHREKHNAK